MIASFIFFSLIIFFLSFKDFFLARKALQGDALAYFEHFKFYINNITHGIFPMWERTRDGGVPTELFMRRINDFNPLHLLIPFLDQIGFSYNIAYFLFLGFCYCLGMVGFYKLSKEIFKSEEAAFVAYLLLMFSSIVTLLFHSFIIFLFAPMVWFFYFIFVFARQQNKFFIWGTLFCLMILFTTYIPFYFLTVFIIFFILTVFIFYSDLLSFIRVGVNFVGGEKRFCLIVLMLLGFSLIPGTLFFQDSQKGEIVLPKRHESVEGYAIDVPRQNLVQGGVFTINFQHELFSNLKKMQMGTFYIPIFAHVLFLLGFMLPLTRRLVFLTLFMLVVYVISVLDASPFYKFLYDHVFFFKYFRNFQFFLWLVLLPIYILICSDHLRAFLQFPLENRSSRKKIFIFLLFIHSAFMLFLTFETNVVMSSYITLFLSLIFFTSWCWNKIHDKRLLIACLTIIILIQPLEVYYYFSRNVKSATPFDRYPDELKPYATLNLPSAQSASLLSSGMDLSGKPKSLFKIPRENSLYMSTKNFAFIYDSLHPDVFNYYTSKSFLIVEQVMPVSEEFNDLELMGPIWATNQNLAFVFTNKPFKVPTDVKITNSKAYIVDENSSLMRVLNTNVNHLTFKTNFDSSKYVVYNDSYHSLWEAYIDGKRVELYRTNLAFKGLWVPGGEHEVYLRFGSIGRYVFKYISWIIFMVTFLILLVWGWRIKRRNIL